MRYEALEMRRLTLLAAAIAAFAVAASGLSATDMTTPPVIKQRATGFGSVLARPDHQVLYYWNVEKRDFKVHCTGSCAKAWPPLIVRSRSAVPLRITGISGTFGTIRRPDGRLQVTRNRLPLYTYAHERPRQVLCNNVNGWFVARA
jgi:predicted lipoprotein with Yx(FWY)xxD motif